MTERTITIKIYWKMLRRLEPILSQLENEIENDKDGEVPFAIPEWRHYFQRLYPAVGWGREDDHPILSTSEAWDVAYSFLYNLYSS